MAKGRVNSNLLNDQAMGIDRCSNNQRNTPFSSDLLSETELNGAPTLSNSNSQLTKAVQSNANLHNSLGDIQNVAQKKVTFQKLIIFKKKKEKVQVNK